MMTLSPEDCAYAAGFFDGEGCIDIRYRKTHGGKYERFELRVHCPQITTRVLYWLLERFGGQVDEHGGPGCSRWHANNRSAADFLKAVLPWLVVKKDQAEVAIEFQSSFDGLRICAHQRGFATTKPEIREKRLNAFLALRNIRKANGIKASGNRDPLSSEKAIRGLSWKIEPMGDNRCAS